MKFQGFQYLYQQLRRDSPRLADTLDRIHDYLLQLSDGFNNLHDSFLTISPLALTYTGTFGLVGEDFVLQLIATGGVQPYNFVLIGDTPPGLTLVDDILSGTPTVDDTYNFTARVTDAAGTIAEVTCSVVIAPAGTVLAPNVTFATLAPVTYELWAHLTVPVFSGTVTLPAVLGTFNVLIVYYTHPGTHHKLMLARYDSGFVGGAVFPWSGYNPEAFVTGDDIVGGKIEFAIYNTAYFQTPGPYTITGVDYSGLAISLLAGTEIPADRWVMRPDRSVRCIFNIQVNMIFYPATVSLISNDGTTNRFVGAYFITEPATLSLGAEDSKEIFYAPLINTNYTMSALIGVWEGDDVNGWRRTDVPDGPYATLGSIPHLFTSAPFSVIQMQPPAATDITLVTYDPGDGSAFPYDRVQEPDAYRDWSIKSFTVDTTLAEQDPNCFVYTLIVTDIDSSGAPIGPRHIWDSTVPLGGVEQKGHLDGPYGSVATPERSADIGGVRFEIYCQSRLDQTTAGWSNVLASKKQTNIDGAGHDFINIFLTSGTTPISLVRGKPLIGKGLVYNVATGTLDLGTGAAALGVMDPNFDNDAAGWFLSAGNSVNTNPTFIRSGVRSLKLVPTGITGSGIASPPFDVVQNQELFFESYVMADGVTGGNRLRMWMAFYDGVGIFLSAGDGDGLGLDRVNSTLPGTTTTFTRIWNYSYSTDPAVRYGRIVYDVIPLSGVGAFYINDILMRPQTSFGPGQERDTHGGVKVIVAGPIYIDIAGGVNIRIGPEYVVTSVGGLLTLTQNTIDLAKAVNFDLTNFKKVGGSFLINFLAVDSLIAGNALFAGTATFAYKNGSTEGGKLTINSLGLTIADKITSPTCTMTVAASGITIANGTNNLQITAFGLVMFVGLTIPLQIDATGILLQNGTSSVRITPTNVTITNGVLDSPVIQAIKNITGGQIIASMSNFAVAGDPGIFVQNTVTGANSQMSASSIVVTLGTSFGFLGTGNLSLHTGSTITDALDLAPFVFRMGNLRTTDPGAGSKEVWCDTTDGNSVKYGI